MDETYMQNVDNVSKPKNTDVNAPSMLYNILGLILAIFYVVAIFILLILFNSGALYAFDVEINALGVVAYIIKLTAGIAYIADLVYAAVICAIALSWAIITIVLVVKLIVAFIGIFPLFKFETTYRDEKVKLGKACRRACSCYGEVLVLMLICRLTNNAGFTGPAIGIIIMAAVVYGISFAFFTFFKSFNRIYRTFDWKVFVVDLARNVVMLAIIILLIAACFKPWLAIINNNYIDFMYLVRAGRVNFEMICDYFIVPILNFAIASAAIKALGKYVGYYILNNGSGGVSFSLRSRFIAVIVLAVIVIVFECLFAFLTASFSTDFLISLIVDNYLGILLISIAGILCALAPSPVSGINQ